MTRLTFHMWPETLGIITGFVGSAVIAWRFGFADLWWTPFIGAVMAFVLMGFARLIIGLPIVTLKGR